MIKSVIATNFLSWERLEFSLESGLTLLEGFNYDDATFEGSGKSSIPNAICWGLFGKIPKDAKVDDVIRNGTDACSVEIEFLDGSRVVRTRKPNDLYIQDPNGSQIRGAGIKETQDLVEQKVGISFEAYCQAVYFAQNFQRKFITATEKERADIISEIQDLKQFDLARTAAHKKIQTQNVALLSALKDQEKNQSLFESSRKQLESLGQLLESFQNEKERDLKKVEVEIAAIIPREVAVINIDQFQENMRKWDQNLEDLYSDRSKIDAELAGIASELRERQRYANQIKANRDQMERMLAKTDKEMSLKKSQLANFMNAPKKHCPECGSVLDEAHVKRHILETTEKLALLEQERNELAAQLDHAEDAPEISQVDTTELTTIKAGIEASIKDTKLYKAETEKALLAARKQKEEQAILNARLKDLEKVRVSIQQRSSEELESKSQEEEHRLNTFETKITECASNIEALKSELAILETLKESFPKVKAFIFKAVLDELTALSGKFLSELFEVPINIRFSNRSEDGELSKIEIDVAIEGISRPLGLYSGGQFKRIELAVDLALSTIISSRSNKPFNLRIFDEPFQGMTSQTMERALGIFQDLKGSTLLIEHNELIKGICSRVFTIEYRDGVSRRVS